MSKKALIIVCVISAILAVLLFCLRGNAESAIIPSYATQQDTYKANLTIDCDTIDDYSIDFKVNDTTIRSIRDKQILQFCS